MLCEPARWKRALRCSAGILPAGPGGIPAARSRCNPIEPFRVVRRNRVGEFQIAKPADLIRGHWQPMHKVRRTLHHIVRSRLAVEPQREYAVLQLLSVRDHVVAGRNAQDLIQVGCRCIGFVTGLGRAGGQEQVWPDAAVRQVRQRADCIARRPWPDFLPQYQTATLAATQFQLNPARGSEVSPASGCLTSHRLASS